MTSDDEPTNRRGSGSSSADPAAAAGHKPGERAFGVGQQAVTLKVDGEACPSMPAANAYCPKAWNRHSYALVSVGRPDLPQVQRTGEA